jgi:hypothetical protein
VTGRPLNPSATPDRIVRLPWLFRNEGLHALEIFLDEAFHIPGIGLRFGIGGIIGLVPGLGGLIASLLTIIIPLAAWIRGARPALLLRMTANLAIALLIGAIPFAGDLFTIYWKPNRRNYRLLLRHIHQPHRHNWRDWLFLLCLLGLIALLFLIPLLVTVGAYSWLARWMHWL